MKNRGMIVCMAAATLLATANSFPQNNSYQGQGQAVVTVLPKKNGTVPSSVTNQDLSVKVNGKNAKVTKWAPFQSPNNSLELVLLIDGSARNSLGAQFGEIEHFVNGLEIETTKGFAGLRLV